MIRRIAFAALGAIVAAAVISGCGVSTGGSEGPTATAMRPVGPAAPPATRAEQATANTAAGPGGQVTVFLHTVGTGFQAASVSFDAASLMLQGGKPAALDLAPAASVDAGSFQLIAHGPTPPGTYDSLKLTAKPDAEANTVTFAAGQAPAPLRLPESMDLGLEDADSGADGRLLLVVTADFADLPRQDDVAVAARRFRAAPLAEDGACTITGEVAPSASLARVHACWGETGIAIAMTQADPFTGEYSLAGLPPGRYQLRITAAGHETYRGPEEPVALAAGKTAELPPIVLSRAKVPAGL
ncbi:MAG: carboxypeptidase regulatory-like domain-containing protein [Armatimonadota bacterium]|nr:MAG: carboxypeptidase regulatory-like domain-containing protein [Armatimonadota bacterium]